MSQAYYLEMLADSYRRVTERDSDRCSRLEFLADHVFDFTTYDSAVSERFAIRAIDVAQAITNGTTVAYRGISTGHYEWYLLMVNMPFFADRLDWGTSIRAAWWRHGPQVMDSTGFYQDGKQCTGPLYFTRENWVDFMNAVAEFARPEMTS